MPPPLGGLRAAFRTLGLGTRPIVQKPLQPGRLSQLRAFADNTTPTEPPTIPGQDGVPVSGNFTKGDPKEEAENAGQGEQGIEKSEAETELNKLALDQLQMVAYGLNPFDPAQVGHKYGLPDLPIPGDMRMKRRYDPVIVQMTRLIMKDGKLSKAQRDMAMILDYLRTSPPPKINPQRPLIPGCPPAEQLPLDPVKYITVAIDSVAPLIRVRGISGMAGGGRALEVPSPLPQRARRRMAFQWILDTVVKKPSRGSGKKMLAHRIGEEIVAIVEGRSAVWEKRNLIHRLGMTARANVNTATMKGITILR